MYEESNKKLFNGGLLSMILKLVLLAIFVFILCWLFTRNTMKGNVITSNDATYASNIGSMKEAAFEYFTTDKLPEDIGGTEKLSLLQMVNQKLLIDFSNDGKACDLDNSYVQATKTADENYALKVSLTCDDTSDFIVTTIEKKNCNAETGVCKEVLERLDELENTIKNNNKTNSSSSNNSNKNNSTSNNNSGSANSSTSNNSSTNNSSSNSSNSSTSSSNSSSTSTTTTTTTTIKTNITITITCPSCEESEKTKYYELVKYGEWQTTKPADGEVYDTVCEETTYYDYCKNNDEKYYTTSYITDYEKDNSSYNYKIDFLNIDASKVKEAKLLSQNYFSDSLTDYKAYLEQRDGDVIWMVGNDGSNNTDIESVELFKNHSLKSNNFTFKISEPYEKNGKYYVDVKINIKNKNGVDPYLSPNLNKNVYLVPAKFDIRFVSNECTKDTAANASKYEGYSKYNKTNEKTCKYRTVKYIWVSEDELESYLKDGWTKTGREEIR